MPGKMRSKQPKGMSPKHVRKSHLVRSSGNDDPIFCETTFDKYYSMSPSSMNSFRDDTRGKLDHLDAEAAAAETNAKRRLFGIAPGSSAAHATSGSPMKKKKKKTNNKGEIVPPDSPDCGLPEWHPARDGKRTSMRIAAYSPEKGISAKTEPVD